MTLKLAMILTYREKEGLMGQSDRKINKLLWTGGWDSTFRLLDLILIKNQIVQPYYTIDEDRPSTGNELKAMKSIKINLCEKFSYAKKLLLPTIFISVQDIPMNEDITDSFNKLLLKYPIGSQYEWLSRYAYSLRMKLENGAQYIHWVPELLGPSLKKVCEANDIFYILDKEKASPEEYLVFGNFLFPCFISKKDSMEIAVKNNLFEIMQYTWFCKSPIKNQKPCGKCNPCQQTISEGMLWRFNKKALVNYWVHMKKKKFVRIFNG
jgi:hypothetical protein